MTVRELVEQLRAIPNQEAQIIVQVPDPDDPQVPDPYTIESVSFIDWPAHYEATGDKLGVAKFSRPEAYINV
jgi:hypothetical protein